MNSVLKRVFHFSTRPTLSTCIFINALLNGVQLYTRTTYTCTVFPYRRNIQAKHCFRFTAKSEWTWIISKHTLEHTVLLCHCSVFTNTLRIFAYSLHSLHSLLTQDKKNKDTDSNAFNSNNENTTTTKSWFFFADAHLSVC